MLPSIIGGSGGASAPSGGWLLLAQALFGPERQAVILVGDLQHGRFSDQVTHFCS